MTHIWKNRLIYLEVHFQIGLIEFGMLKNIVWTNFCQTPVLGLGLGVDFTFAWDNIDNNDNNDKNNNKNNPHLDFVKGTVVPGD